MFQEPHIKRVREKVLPTVTQHLVREIVSPNQTIRQQVWIMTTLIVMLKFCCFLDCRLSCTLSMSSSDTYNVEQFLESYHLLQCSHLISNLASTIMSEIPQYSTVLFNCTPTNSVINYLLLYYLTSERRRFSILVTTNITDYHLILNLV